MLREGFLEEVTRGLILEGSVGICQRSEVWVGIADTVAADRWGQHSVANALQEVWEAGEGLEGDSSD